MKNKWVKLVSAILLIAMLAVSFAACSGKKGNDNPGTSPTQGGSQATGEQQTPETLDPNSDQVRFQPEKEDFDYTYTILTECNEAYNLEFYITECADHQNDVVAAALYNREQILFENYNVEMELKINDNPQTLLRQAMMGNEPVCDISTIFQWNMIPLVQEGVFANLLECDDLNLEASYWDQNIQTECRVGDKLFFIEGDYSNYDELVTMAIIYNQTVYDKNGYTEKYGTLNSLVKDKKWTYETMWEMITDLGWDSNSDGVHDDRDEWGFVTETAAVYHFFAAAGLKVISNDENGELKNYMDDPASYATIQGLFDKLYGDTGISIRNPDVLIADANGTMWSEDIWTSASDVIQYDRALFRSTTLKTVMRLTDMESTYGLLPFPLMMEGQTEYHTITPGANLMPLCLYVHAQDIVKAGKITERMAYHSRYGDYTVYQSLYDYLNLNRLGTSAEDVETLETLFASKYYDMDVFMEFSNIYDALMEYVKEGSTTSLNTLLQNAQNNIEINLKKFEDNLKTNYCSPWAD